jgi:uncharacterized phage protein gp47/JayE
VAAPLPSAIYSDRDLTTLRTRFRALIRSVFSNWSDFSVANFGNLLADLYVFTAELQGFYLNAHAAEAFAPTAVQRRSLLRFSQLVGYRPRGSAPASTDVTFTAADLAGDCIIPAGTVVKTRSQANPLEYQTLAPITLFAEGPSTATVTVEHSKPATESFTSSGQPKFNLQLSNTPYLDRSLSISTSQGPFVEVVSFVSSKPSDRVFVVSVDDNDRATITFGDGVSAGLPPTGTISAEYRTGGGSVGNTPEHTIQSIEVPLFDVNGALVTITCDNAAPATGGADREGAESIRVTAPASITAPTVSVARSDFEIHAEQVAGIDRALYLTQNEDPTIPVLVSPGVDGANYPDEAHVSAVKAQFTKSDGTRAPFAMMATQVLNVIAAPILEVGVMARIYLKKNRTSLPQAQYEAAIAVAVRASLAAFFATTVKNDDGTLSKNAEMDFGYYLGDESPGAVLAASDVANAIRDTEGVRELGPQPADLTLAATTKVLGAAPVATQAAARQDIVLQAADFPRLGNVVLVNGDTGGLL